MAAGAKHKRSIILLGPLTIYQSKLCAWTTLPDGVCLYPDAGMPQGILRVSVSLAGVPFPWVTVILHSLVYRHVVWQDPLPYQELQLVSCCALTDKYCCLKGKQQLSEDNRARLVTTIILNKTYPKGTNTTGHNNFSFQVLITLKSLEVLLGSWSTHVWGFRRRHKNPSRGSVVKADYVYP